MPQENILKLKCSIIGCENIPYCKDICRKHNTINRNSKGLLPFERLKNICHCGKRVHAYNLCRNHYRRGLTIKNPEIMKKTRTKKCEFTGCNNIKNGKYCGTHRYVNINTRFRLQVRLAKKRGIIWDIRLDEYDKLIKNNCYYCNTEEIGFSCGLDRVDSNGDYSVSNVVTCCGDCNKLKNNILSKNEMVEVIKLLVLLRNKKQIWKIGV